MNDSEARPDIAGNRTETANTAPFRYFDSRTPGLRFSAPSGRFSPSRGPLELDDAALAASDPETLTSYELVREVKRLRSRVAAVEANAEVLIVARHDLMAEVDQVTLALAENANWIRGETSGYGSDWSNGPARIDGNAYSDTMTDAFQLLDRLAAYMKGQDDRLVAVGERATMAESRERYWRDRADQTKTELSFVKSELAVEIAKVAGMWDRVESVGEERDTARDAAQHYRDALVDVGGVLGAGEDGIAEAHGVIELALTALPTDKTDRFRTLVERIANWTDAEVERASPAQVRHVAQVVRDGAEPEYPPFGDHGLPIKPRCRVVTSPRFYSDEQRENAALDLSDHPIFGFTFDAERQRVDIVAKALGMRRAGA